MTPLTIAAAEHPDGITARLGFELTDPYVEACWLPTIGPTCTALLRRMPALWSAGPYVVTTREALARSVGVSAREDRKPPLSLALARLVTFNMAAWASTDVLAVYTRVRPLTGSCLAHAKPVEQAAHQALLERHLAGLAVPA